jgi:hypothetical protein
MEISMLKSRTRISVTFPEKLSRLLYEYFLGYVLSPAESGEVIRLDKRELDSQLDAYSLASHVHYHRQLDLDRSAQEIDLMTLSREEFAAVVREGVREDARRLYRRLGAKAVP